MQIAPKTVSLMALSKHDANNLAISEGTLYLYLPIIIYLCILRRRQSWYSSFHIYFYRPTRLDIHVV